MDVCFWFGWALRKSGYKHNKDNDHSREQITHMKAINPIVC